MPNGDARRVRVSAVLVRLHVRHRAGASTIAEATRASTLSTRASQLQGRTAKRRDARKEVPSSIRRIHEQRHR